MQKYDNYIEKLIDKINNVDDEELKQLVFRLINERYELHDCANIDELTGLYNRRALEEVKEYCLVVLADVDNFKKINDTYGHDIGDEVLKIISSILLSSTRPNDLVIRYGGDEFLIVFNYCTLDVVVNRLLFIQKKIEETLKDKNINTSVSVGISEYKEGKLLSEAITEADIALYESKEKGKKQLTIYNKKSLVKELN